MTQALRLKTIQPLHLKECIDICKEAVDRVEDANMWTTLGDALLECHRAAMNLELENPEPNQWT